MLQSIVRPAPVYMLAAWGLVRVLAQAASCPLFVILEPGGAGGSQEEPGSSCLSAPGSSWLQARHKYNGMGSAGRRRGSAGRCGVLGGAWGIAGKNSASFGTNKMEWAGSGVLGGAGGVHGESGSSGACRAVKCSELYDLYNKIHWNGACWGVLGCALSKSTSSV